MALATDNKSLHLLRSFAQRRRRLILLRGLAATVLVLLGAMFVVAMLDRLVLLELPARLALSLGAYVSAVVVAWFVAGRELMRPDNPAELARMIESAEPVLRNRLLAAIELGQWANGAAAFRQIVREDANRRAAQVRVERTLPWRLISWWIGAGAGAIALCAILLSVPNLQFGRMLGRALLPTASIPRASRYTVAFTGEGETRLVPASEAFDFEVLVTGGQPHAVTLKIEPQQQPVRTVAMEPAGVGDKGLLYRAAVALDGPARLRAWADDADSRRLRVEVRPRPSVVDFTKTYTPPTYLLNHARPAVTVTEDSGALEALQDSTALVELKPDQPIRSGYIQLLGTDGEPLAGASAIELTPAAGLYEGARMLRASVPIAFDGAYRVELVAAETGFETRHSPIWPVRAILDMPPTVQAEAVEGRPVSPDALLSLRALVEDDVGLAWTRRDVRLNGGEWRSGTLEEPGDAPAQIEWGAPLDLLSLGLVPGDRVESRLVVSDLKGGEAVGSFGEWIIVADGVEDTRLQTLIAKQELAQATSRMAQAAAQLEQERGQAAARLAALARTGAGDSIEVDQLLLSLSTRARSAQDAADQTQNAAVAAMGRMIVGRDARDVERIGQAAAAVTDQINEILLGLENRVQASDQRLASSQDACAEATELASAGASLAETLLHTEQAALAARELRLTLNESMQQLEQFRAQFADAAPDDQVFLRQQLSRSAAATAARLQGARQRMDEVRPALAGDREALARIDEIRALCDRSAERLRRALREEPGEDLLEPAARVRDTIIASLPPLGEIAVALEQRLAQDRQRPQLPATAGALDDLAEDVPGGSADWNSAISRLGSRARLHERRVELDRAFMSDLTLAQRAVRAMTVADEDLEDPAAVSRRAVEVARAMHTLETGHELAELRLRMAAMHEAERTEPDRWSLDRWRDWLSFKSELDPAAQQLARVGHAPQAVAKLSGLSRQSASVRYETALQSPEDPVARGQAVEASGAMLAELTAGQQLLEPAMAEARAVLARDAMPLSEWMKQLAAEAGAMAQRTRTAEDAEEVAADQEEFDARVLELEEAIRRDAAQQELQTEAGRERARDADDALAMLRDDRNRTADRLEAAGAAAPEERAEAMKGAADAQQQSADTLAQLAEHYRNLEGAPESAQDSRAGLREHEDELGIKQRLDSEYEQMQRLADMQKLDDPEMLKALEQELKDNEGMQRELGKVADDAARQGRQQLDEAAHQERGVQQDVADAAQAVERDKQLAESRAQRLAEMARQISEKDLPELDERLAEGPEAVRSAEEMKRAAEAVEQAAKAAEGDDFSRAAKALQEAKQDLEQIEQRQRQQWEQSASEMYEAAQKANAARNAGTTDPQADAQRAAANESAQAANRSRVAAQQARENVQKAAQEAQRLQQQSGQAQQQSDQALKEAAQQQDEIGEDAQEAADTLDRAARHEERLGNGQKSDAMEQASEAARQAGNEQVPAAASAARQAKQAADAMKPIEEAAGALEAGAEAARQASAVADQSPSPAASDRAGSMMAQALDRLDRAMKGRPQNAQAPEPSNAGNQPGSQSARAMAQRAADSQARSMRDRRLPTPPGTPSGEVTSGADLQGMPEEELTADRLPGGGDWGKLPPEIVKDLVQGQRDTAPAEYRDLVEAYYRAIAARARARE